MLRPWGRGHLNLCFVPLVMQPSLTAQVWFPHARKKHRHAQGSRNFWLAQYLDSRKSHSTSYDPGHFTLAIVKSKDGIFSKQLIHALVSKFLMYSVQESQMVFWFNQPRILSPTAEIYSMTIQWHVCGIVWNTGLWNGKAGTQKVQNWCRFISMCLDATEQQCEHSHYSR